MRVGELRKLYCCPQKIGPACILIRCVRLFHLMCPLNLVRLFCVIIRPFREVNPGIFNKINVQLFCKPQKLKKSDIVLVYWTLQTKWYSIRQRAVNRKEKRHWPSPILRKRGVCYEAIYQLVRRIQQKSCRTP